MNTDKITQYLEQMAAKLGVAAEHVYGVLVTQAFAQGIVYLVGAAMCIIGILLIVKFARTLFEYLEEIGALLITGGCLLFGFGAYSLGADGLMHAINPEYYALKEIMDVIGGITR